MLAPQLPKIRSREISDADINDVIDLLVRGYAYRPRQFWVRAFDRLTRHPTPAGLPKYGYLIESSGTPVGAILLIFSSVRTDDGSATIRCSIGGWCVDPAFRSYASMLSLKALGRKDVTYITVPGPEIRRIVEAQGFSPYSGGQIVAIPALSSLGSDADVSVVEGSALPNVPFESFERDLLQAHAEFGCISLWCITADRAYPFVFHPRNVRGFIPCARLVYCPKIEDFIRFARPIGQYLAKRGRPFVLIDSKGPIPGLVGRYFEGSRPKYFKGPIRPRLGDLAYTQLSMFEV